MADPAQEREREAVGLREAVRVGVVRGVRVLECRVEAANLEDVFMNVTKGDVA